MAKRGIGAPAPKAILRADVSDKLGQGHLSRAIAMAKTLERNGIPSIIFSRVFGQSPQTAIAKLSEHQGQFQILHSEDEFLAYLERKEADYLFIDLSESSAYESLASRLRPLFPAYYTICFDSFFDQTLPFQLYVRPLFDGNSAEKNALVGLKYYVFREELRSLASQKIPPQECRNVLVSLGGSDPFCASSKISRMLCHAFPELKFTVVVGPGFAAAERKELEKLSRQFNNLHCEMEPPQLGPLFLQADLAITSGGLTKFEAALFGVPCLILANTRQEETLSEEFAALGSSIYCGRADSLDSEKLAGTLRALWKDRPRLAEMSRMGREILDIHGGDRVLEYVRQNKR